MWLKLMSICLIVLISNVAKKLHFTSKNAFLFWHNILDCTYSHNNKLIDFNWFELSTKNKRFVQFWPQIKLINLLQHSFTFHVHLNIWTKKSFIVILLIQFYFLYLAPQSPAEHSNRRRTSPKVPISTILSNMQQPH